MTTENLYNKKGFTLIELLVVVAVIATLAAIVLVALDVAKADARDAQRLTAMRELEKALEVYVTYTNEYPPHDSGTQVASSLTELVPDYIYELPLDPVEGDTSNGYRYAREGVNNYTLLVQFEGDDHNSWCGISHGSGYISWVSAAWYHEVTDPECEI